MASDGISGVDTIALDHSYNAITIDSSWDTDEEITITSYSFGTQQKKQMQVSINAIQCGL